MKKLLFAIMVLLAIPAHAQVTQPGQLTTNTLNSTVNLVTLDTAAVALEETVTTPGPASLACSTYPVVTFIVTRNAVNSTLAVVTIASGVYWQASPLFTSLLPGDLIFAKLTTAGIGCSNELPFTVSTIYSPQAGLCDANPSACVTLTGTIAGTNGLTAKNLTLTFRHSQMAFLGGVPPANSPAAEPSGGGACGGTAPNYAVCSAVPSTEYGDSHFEYDTATYAKPYVLIDTSAGISSGSVTNANEQFGYNADASSDHSIGNTAVGNGAQAIGGEATAVGNAAVANAFGAIAIGGSQVDALASGENSIAIGTNAFATTTTDIAIGLSANAVDLSSIAIGEAARTDANTVSSIAIGDGVFIADGGSSSVIIGDGAQNAVVSTGYDSCNAIGNGAHCLGADSAAYGEGAAAAQSSIAIGLSEAAGEESIAIGDGASAAGVGSVVIGGLGGVDNGHDDSLLLGYEAGTGATAAHQIWLGSTTATDLYFGNTAGVTVHNVNLPPVYGPTGTLAALPHTVIGTCAIGSTCSVTLSGAAVFTSNTSYICVAQDQSGIFATKVAQSSGSAFAITGNGTDTVAYICTGN